MTDLNFEDIIGRYFNLNLKIFVGKSNLLQNPFDIKKNDGTPFQVFTPFWKNAEIHYLNNNNIEKPKLFNKMINLVENMAKTLKRHCRIDVYIVNNDIYLGEFTFFTGAKLPKGSNTVIIQEDVKVLNNEDYRYYFFYI